MLRQWFKGISWLAFLVAFGGLSVGINTAMAQMRNGAYIVQKGDTLWDIAARFLDEPWRWKEIWRANPDIKNPHLIYPGDQLIFEQVNGKDQIRLVRGDGVSQRTLSDGTVKLTPQIRSGPADKAIPTIPLNVIGPFLNDSRIVSEYEVKHSGTIVAVDEDHLVVGEGDRVYIHRKENFTPHKSYLIIRPGKMYKHPKSKAELGREGELLGRVRLEHVGNPSSFIITRSFAEIKVGDRVFESHSEPVSPYFFPRTPVGQAGGQILAVQGGLNQIGQHQVVVLTGGHDQQREVGDVLAVIQKQKDLPSRFMAKKKEPLDFPALTVGRVIVFRIFDKVSYGLVLSATRPIYLLDEVVKP